jgi:hypothetical protein
MQHESSIHSKIEDPKDKLISQVHKDLISREINKDIVNLIINQLKLIPNIERNNNLILTSAVYIIRNFSDLSSTLLGNKEFRVEDIKEDLDMYTQILEKESINIVSNVALKTKKNLEITPYILVRTKIDIFTCMKLIYDYIKDI